MPGLETYRINSEFTVTGIWWTDCGALNQVIGTLTHEPAGSLYLDLHVSFRITDDRKLDGLRVYGELASGQKVTLTEVLCVQHSLGFYKLSHVKLLSNVGFIGQKLISESEVFYSATVRTSNIDIWMNRQPYSREVNKKNKDQAFTTAVTHTCEVSHKIHVDEISATLLFFNMIHYESTKSDRVLKNKEYVRVVPRRKQSANWYIKQAHSICVFMSTLSTLPGMVDDIELRCSKSRCNTNSIHDPYVSVLVSVDKNTSQYRAHDGLICYTDIKHRLKSILGGWFSRNKSSVLATNLIHSLELSKYNLDIALLIRVQAFESVMQERKFSLYIEKSEYKVLRKSILSEIYEKIPDNPELRNSIADSLNFGNVKSLREKMLEVCSDVDQELLRRLLMDDQYDFCSSVSATRNYFTHRHQKTSVMVKSSGKPLYDLNDSLKWFLWYLMISELPIPRGKFKEVMLKHNRLSGFQRGR